MARRFLFGGNYYPHFHPPDEWARDIGFMRDAHMTATRTGELLCGWDRIEVREGVYDWGWLDGLFDQATRHDFAVVLGTGSASPPRWLARKYPDIVIRSRDGLTHPLGSTWNWACHNHPGFRSEVARYIAALAKRYGAHPHLAAWQVNNEPGHPFIEQVGKLVLYDYHPYTQDRFRAWLQRKYTTLDALNWAWTWLSTNLAYEEWAQIEAPRALPAEWGGVTAWLDWRTFCDDDLADYIAWEANVLRRADAAHQVMTNSFVLSRHDPFGVGMGLDQWKLASAVDVIGLDMYPGLENRHLREPEYTSLFLDIGLSIARSTGKPYWLPELQSGPIGGWMLGPTHAADGHDIARFTIDGLAHGVKQIGYQGWREWRPQPMHWGGMADLEGQPTEIAARVADVGDLLARHGQRFLDAEPPLPQVGIVYSKPNAIVMAGVGQSDFVLECMRGAYKTLWEAGIPVGFVTASELASGQLDGYKLLLLPAIFLVSEAEGAAIHAFVERGGHVVVGAKCAMLDERGWYHTRRPGASLAALCGVVERSVSVVSDGHWRYADVAVPVAHHRTTLELLAADVEIVGRWDDGTPAATSRIVGAGRVLYIGTHLERACLADPTGAASRVLLDAVRAANVVPPLRHVGEAPAPGVVDLHLLRGDGYALLVGWTAHTQDHHLTLAVDWPYRAAVACAARTDQPVDVALADGVATLTLDIPARGWSALLMRDAPEATA